MAWISLFQKALNLGKVYKTKNLLPDIDNMTSELYTSKLNTNIFNYYTGHTSGATVDISGKLDKIIFNQYTGDTNIILNNLNNNKLEVSLFNQYTGSTENNFSGVTVNKFNSYTAQTQTNLYNKLDKFVFNYYTGHTPTNISGVTKQEFNKYTGDTQNNLFLKLDKIIFNQYTGNTDNKINYISGITNTKLNIIDFNGYSGRTLTQLNDLNNNKLDKSVFNYYTGHTSGTTNGVTISQFNSYTGNTNNKINHISGVTDNKENKIDTAIIFNPNSIVLNKHETYFSDYTQLSGLTITTPINNYGQGASFLVNIITNGQPISLYNGAVIRNDYDNTAGYFGLASVFNSAYIINLFKLDITTPPIFSNVSIDTITTTTARFNSQINKSGTIYWANYTSGNTITNKSFIFNGTGALQHGNIVTTGNTITHAALTGLTANNGYKVYYYGVNTSSNETDIQAALSYTTSNPIQLSAPSLSATTLSQSSLRYNWNNISNNNGYGFAISTNSGSTFNTPIDLGINVNSYTITGLTSNTRRDGKVYTKGDNINTLNSIYSNIAFTSTNNLTQLSTPTNNTITGVTKTSIVANVSNIDIHASFLKLEYKPTTAATFTAISSTLPRTTIKYTISGLTANTSYDTRWTAIGDNITYSNSNASGIQTITTQALNVTFISGSTSTDGLIVTIKYSKTMPSNPTFNGLSFSPSGHTITASTRNVIDTSSVDYHLSNSFANGNVITATYNNGNIIANDGGVLTNFSNQSITNNILSSYFPFNVLLNSTYSLGILTNTSINGQATNNTPVSGDFIIYQQIIGDINNQAVLGIDANSGNELYANFDFGVYTYAASGFPKTISKIISGTPSSTGQSNVINEYIGMRRIGTVLDFIKSSDAINWTIVATTSISTGNMYIKACIIPTIGQMQHPKFIQL